MNGHTIAPADLDQLAQTIAILVADEISKRPRLVDRHTLAAQLGVSVPTIDRLRRDGRIPAIMVGSRPMFDPTATVAALAGGRNG